MNAETKLVFLSHAFEDKEIAEKIAGQLIAKGINVWFDKWEIKAGDSLVEKVFTEGLKRCAVFMILLSGKSVRSSWVKYELDVAMINKISGVTKILPVIVERCEIPVPLKPLLWIDLADGWDKGIQKMVESILDIDRKPPLGPRMVVASTLDKQVPGLSRVATAIGLLFMETGTATSDYQLGARGSFLLDELPGVTPQMLNDGVDELESLGLVKSRNAIGSAPFDFWEIYPTYLLYLYFKGEGLGYDPERDIREVASAIASKESLGGEEMTSLTSIPVVRINRAVAYLDDNGIVSVLKFLGTAPFDFGMIRATRRTREFVRDNE